MRRKTENAGENGRCLKECTAQELFELLNELDETDSLEAKSLHEDSTRSIMESVCAFSNEPGMGGGVILLGAREAKDVDRDAPLYVAEGVDRGALEALKIEFRQTPYDLVTRR